MTQPMPTPILPTLPAAHDERGLGGLLALVNGAEQALPLRHVKVRAHLAGAAARVVVEQRFANPHDHPIEAVHIFPLPPDGAVTELTLRAGELEIVGECQARATAEQTFADARKAGHRAGLLTAERADVHTLRVTNLPPGEEIVVRIVVVQPLEAADGRMRWRFPTTIAPRYLPGTPIGHSGAGTLPDTDQAPDASRLQPPIRLAGGTPLDAEITLAGPITHLASSLHAVRMDMEDGAVRVAPSESATLDRDLLLAFATAEDAHTTARAWSDGEHTLVIVEPPSVAMPTPIPRDAVFVVDISGSMGGTKMTAAKIALKAALHGLVEGDAFKLIAFDDRLEHFAPAFTAYREDALNAADAWVDALHARGGTEMLPAIRAALEGATPAGRVRTVLFITDGQAHNEAELARAVAARDARTAFFSMGIDTAVNSSLLTRLARFGGGTCELLTPRDDIEAAVSRLEARFGAPVASNLTVEGRTAARPDAAIAFSGRPAAMWVESAGATVTVTGETAAGPWSTTVTCQPAAMPLAALWARERIAFLEDRLLLAPPAEQGALEARITAIALAAGIASRGTAFVAVDRSRAIEGSAVEIVQPVELPADWDQSFGGVQMSVAMSIAPPPAPPSGPPRPARRSAGLAQRMRAMLGGGGAGDRADAIEMEEAADMMMAPRVESAAAAPPSRAAAKARRAAPAPSAPRAAPKAEQATPADPLAALARTQRADGSFEGQVAATAAALWLLLLAGHTRRAGTRQRTVLKAAAWLARHAGDPLADAALAALADAEAGRQVPPVPPELTPHRR